MDSYVRNTKHQFIMCVGIRNFRVACARGMQMVSAGLGRPSSFSSGLTMAVDNDVDLSRASALTFVQPVHPHPCPQRAP